MLDIMSKENIYSVMFHHFHDDKHREVQGSLSANNFKRMIDWISKNYSIIGANEYKNKFNNNSLKENDVCLTFDDALKCQYDIAIPILNEYGIDAFFFIYSSALTEKPDFLEIYRYFRTTSFDNIDEFYIAFFNIVENKDLLNYRKAHIFYKEIDYLAAFPFYSENDKWFRFLRDHFLERDNYDKIMFDLMKMNNFDVEAAKRLLFMSSSDVLDISKKGHEIGLHSYSHPTQMNKLSRSQQEYEYKSNYEQLTNLIAKPITTMSHPCGSYNEDTLKILLKLNIKMGFRSSLSVKNIISNLEVPREDQANILKKMFK